MYKINDPSFYEKGDLTGYCKCGVDLGNLTQVEIEQHFLNHKRKWWSS